jgi:hypothetical protein
MTMNTAILWNVTPYGLVDVTFQRKMPSPSYTDDEEAVISTEISVMSTRLRGVYHIPKDGYFHCRLSLCEFHFYILITRS